MNSKVVSFQIVQSDQGNWSPDVVALCEDGSLWVIGLSNYEKPERKAKWTRLTPEPCAHTAFGTINV